MASVLIALDQQVANLVARIDDGLDLMEHLEPLAGLGCVAIQVYIDGTATDLGKVFSLCPGREELNRCEAPTLAPTGISFVQAIGAAANHFKHKDDPKYWTGPRGKKRRIVLEALGISESTEFPCVEVVRRMQGDTWKLLPLLEVARTWRESWFKTLRGDKAVSDISWDGQ